MHARLPRGVESILPGQPNSDLCGTTAKGVTPQRGIEDTIAWLSGIKMIHLYSIYFLPYFSGLSNVKANSCKSVF